MRHRDTDLEELLPIELKLRLLQAEMERLDSDLDVIERRRLELHQEIRYYENLRHKRILRRVK
jgi:prefoldin subunit 5